MKCVNYLIRLVTETFGNSRTIYGTALPDTSLFHFGNLRRSYTCLQLVFSISIIASDEKHDVIKHMILMNL